MGIYRVRGIRCKTASRLNLIAPIVALVREEEELRQWLVAELGVLDDVHAPDLTYVTRLDRWQSVLEQLCARLGDPVLVGSEFWYGPPQRLRDHRIAGEPIPHLKNLDSSLVKRQASLLSQIGAAIVASWLRYDEVMQ
jgi:hypothetical protein